MTNIKHLELQLEFIQEEISSLSARARYIKEEIRKKNARRTIDEYDLTIEDVEVYDDGEKPWFNAVFEFGAWMVENNIKNPFYSWCGAIYKTRDLLMEGKMEYVCRVEDLALD